MLSIFNSQVRDILFKEAFSFKKLSSHPLTPPPKDFSPVFIAPKSFFFF